MSNSTRFRSDLAGAYDYLVESNDAANTDCLSARISTLGDGAGPTAAVLLALAVTQVLEDTGRTESGISNVAALDELSGPIKEEWDGVVQTARLQALGFSIAIAAGDSSVAELMYSRCLNPVILIKELEMTLLIPLAQEAAGRQGITVRQYLVDRGNIAERQVREAS